MLDGADLDPAAVFAVAQGKVGVAATAQVPDGKRHVAGDLPRVDVGFNARAAQGPGGETCVGEAAGLLVDGERRPQAEVVVFLGLVDVLLGAPGQPSAYDMGPLGEVVALAVGDDPPGENLPPARAVLRFKACECVFCHGWPF